MRHEARTASLVLVAALLGACATGQTRMARALDPSMERVLVAESYLGTVTGVSSHPERLMRSDGYVYVADVAPVMRYYAERGDTAPYLALRRYLVANLTRRQETGVELARRYRAGQSFEPAAPSGYFWARKALVQGWQNLGDTTSAVVLAQMVASGSAEASAGSALQSLALACADALELLPGDAAPARATLARGRELVGRRRAPVASTLGGAEGEVDLLSCLTRAGVALDDPDASVRYLDRMLDILSPIQSRSGRTDLGTGADVLLTLHTVRQAGPAWSRPGGPYGR